jgi:hypothetical protein
VLTDSPQIAVKCARKRIVWTSNNRLKWNQSVSFGDGKCLLTFFSSCIQSKERRAITVCYTQTGYVCNVYGQSWQYFEGCGGGVVWGVHVFSTCSYILLPRDNVCLNVIAVVFIGFWCYSGATTEVQSRLWKHVLSNLRAVFFMLEVWLLNDVTIPSSKE